MNRQAKPPSAKLKANPRAGVARRTAFGLACLCLLALAAALGSGAPTAGAEAACPNEALRSEQHSTFLPQCRAYELVTPPTKNGAGVYADSSRTRSSVDGNALGYASLGAFGEVSGTDIATDYIAQRSTDAEPGDNGWHSHAITPPQLPTNGQGVFNKVTGFLATIYQGEMSPDLNRGIVPSLTPLTEDPNVTGVPNLYRRSDLLQPGKGTYELLSECSRCAEQSQPLPDMPLTNRGADFGARLDWASPDLQHVILESKQRLTSDTPESPNCDLSTEISATVTARFCRVHLYEAGDGQIRLAGRIPADPTTETSCDDSGSNHCVPADLSVAGSGNLNHTASALRYTPHTISNESDGHTRVFFMQPTGPSGETSEQSGNSPFINEVPYEGRLFMRVDGISTVEIDAPQRVPAAEFAPASFLDASADGHRVFFKSNATLTAAPGGGLYMYEAEPHSAVQRLEVAAVAGTFNLTFGGQATSDLPFDATAAEVQTALNGLATIGGVGGSVEVSGGPGSETGSSPYEIEFGGTLADEPVEEITAADGSAPLSGGSPSTVASVTTTVSGGHLTLISGGHEVIGTIGVSANGAYVYFLSPEGIYLWHDGGITFVAPNPGGTAAFEVAPFESNVVLEPQQSRVSPDGRHLLFSTPSGVGVLSAHGGVDYDQGSCESGLGTGCRELYLYSADTDSIQCASCNPSGTPATAMASTVVRKFGAAAGISWHHNYALSNDGRYVFFSTDESLLPTDTNGTSDAYEFDSQSGDVHLLSTGAVLEPSYFLEASPDGTNAFFATAQPLAGWDKDSTYDIYDARIAGGFPEPKAIPAPCEGEACRTADQTAPGNAGNGTSGFTGPGNGKAHRHRRHRHRKRHRHAHHRHKHARNPNHNRRTIR